MIEVQIPKDVSGYEAPLIGPLTSRQAICVAAAAAVEYIYYNIMNALNLGLDMNSVICIGVLLAAPILYLAIGKPYGMRAEVYIYNYFVPSVIANKTRPYETKIVYDTLLETIEKIESESEDKKTKEKKAAEAKAKEKQKQKQIQKPKRARGKQDIMYA